MGTHYQYLSELNPTFCYFSVSRTPHADLESRVRFKIPEETRSSRKFDSVRTAPRVAKLSFEDYHVTWSGIATSKARQDLKNPC